METERIQKILSNLGVCSRRKAEQAVLEGRVKVNGAVVKETGFKCLATDEIEFDGELVNKPEQVEPVYLAFNKPYDVVSTTSDPQGRQTVVEFIPKRFGRVFPIGRLDHNSTGLMIMTNDGELANLVSHPSSAPEKEYLVKVKGELKGDECDRLAKGLYITREGYTAKPCQARVIKKDETGAIFSIILHEGKKREIRHMMATMGLDVKILMRIRIGNIMLGKLKEGQYREISKADIEALKDNCRENKLYNPYSDKDPYDHDDEE